MRKLLTAWTILLFACGCIRVYRLHSSVATFQPGSRALIQSSPALIQTTRDDFAPVVGFAEVGDRIRVVEVERPWVKVRQRRTVGWMHEHAFMTEARRTGPTSSEPPVASPTPAAELEQMVKEYMDYLTNRPSCF